MYTMFSPPLSRTHKLLPSDAACKDGPDSIKSFSFPPKKKCVANIILTHGKLHDVRSHRASVDAHVGMTQVKSHVTRE